jgi:membrane protein insertase Oxa1/YidC/SpoIIIJ
MKHMRRTHGIYPMISMMNILQMPVHLVYISLVNRLSLNYDLNPAILTEGFLWFKDLSAPDPYGILPIIGGLITWLNILSTSTTTVSPTMRKMKKFLFLLPMISIPIWMTFPAVKLILMHIIF